jgi:crotonobetaine/carnitine-CoA ligase
MTGDRCNSSHKHEHDPSTKRGLIVHGQYVGASNLAELITARATLGDKPLLRVGEELLTYGEADKRSNQLANGLRARNVGKGDVVATFARNSIDHLCVWFACAKLGAVWSPLNSALMSSDLKYALEDSTAQVLFLDEELLAPFLRARTALANPPRAILLGSPRTASEHGLTPFADLVSDDVGRPEVEIAPGDPMSIIYTGGSTGPPKGVLVSHLYYLSSGVRYATAADPTPEDVHFTIGHLFHTGGQSIGVMGPMMAQMTTVMAVKFSASRYWDRIRDCAATIIDPIGPIIGAVMAQDLRADDRDHKVRIGVGVATGQIRREVRRGFEERFGVPLLEVYAQTETGVILTTETLTDRRGSNGKPADWLESKILDPQGFPVAPGEVGEISIRLREPNCFMLQYWRKPEETVRAWRDLWFHTGDLGYMDDEGYLFFTGRQAHWIRRRGENVSAFEVEQTVAELSGVADCAAVGVPAEIGDEDVKVYVQLEPGVQLEPRAVVAHCEERIARFKVPRYVEFVASLPRSAAKMEVERHTLRQQGVGDAWDATTSL